MLERDKASAAHDMVVDIQAQLGSLAAHLGALDSRKRDDRAIADAILAAKQAVDELAARLRAFVESLGGPDPPSA